MHGHPQVARQTQEPGSWQQGWKPTKDKLCTSRSWANRMASDAEVQETDSKSVNFQDSDLEDGDNKLVDVLEKTKKLLHKKCTWKVPNCSSLNIAIFEYLKDRPSICPIETDLLASRLQHSAKYISAGG